MTCYLLLRIAAAVLTFNALNWNFANTVMIHHKKKKKKRLNTCIVFGLIGAGVIPT